VKLFVASCGRTGTMYMANVIGHLTDIPSFHEPSPYCIDRVCEEVNNDRISPESQRELDQKINEITRHSKDGNYCETSNMFIKSFVWSVIDNFDDIYCIYIYRNTVDLLLSHHMKNPWRAGAYYLESDWKRNVLRTETRLSWFDRLLWHQYEIRARFDFWKPKFQKTWIFKFEDIANLDEYYRMFDHFGIDYSKADKLPEFKRNAEMATHLKKGTTKEGLVKEIIKYWDGWPDEEGIKKTKKSL